MKCLSDARKAAALGRDGGVRQELAAGVFRGFAPDSIPEKMSHGSLPPSPPAEKATARQDQTGVYGSLAVPHLLPNHQGSGLIVSGSGVHL
jgi:hypothetical protein